MLLLHDLLACLMFVCRFAFVFCLGCFAVGCFLYLDCRLFIVSVIGCLLCCFVC